MAAQNQRQLLDKIKELKKLNSTLNKDNAELKIQAQDKAVKIENLHTCLSKADARIEKEMAKRIEESKRANETIQALKTTCNEQEQKLREKKAKKLECLNRLEKETQDLICQNEKLTIKLKQETADKKKLRKEMERDIQVWRDILDQVTEDNRAYGFITQCSSLIDTIMKLEEENEKLVDDILDKDHELQVKDLQYAKIKSDNLSLMQRLDLFMKKEAEMRSKRAKEYHSAVKDYKRDKKCLEKELADKEILETQLADYKETVIAPLQQNIKQLQDASSMQEKKIKQQEKENNTLMQRLHGTESEITKLNKKLKTQGSSTVSENT